MRVVSGFVLALCVAISAYFGSAQVAHSAQAKLRIVRLSLGDVAVNGKVQCRVFTHSASHPVRYAQFQCSRGPLSKSPYSAVVGGQINVYQKGVSAPIYSTPCPAACAAHVANSGKATRIVRLSLGDVAAIGEVQCRAETHSLRCSMGPLSKAAYSADTTPSQINVYKKGVSTPIYSTPAPTGG